MKELMDYPEFRNHKLIRVVVEQEFGRWCHESKLPDGGSDFGMCQSYRWALGIEGHHPGTITEDESERIVYRRKPGMQHYTPLLCTALYMGSWIQSPGCTLPRR